MEERDSGNHCRQTTGEDWPYCPGEGPRAVKNLLNYMTGQQPFNSEHLCLSSLTEALCKTLIPGESLLLDMDNMKIRDDTINRGS